MTALYTWGYLLDRLNIGFDHYWLLTLCRDSGGVIITTGTSGRDIILHKLFLELCLLLPLPSDLLLAQVLIAVIGISVKINGWTLSCKHVTLLGRSHYHLLGWVLNNDFRHMLSKCGSLLVGVRGWVSTWWSIISTWVTVCIVESLRWIQDLTQTLLNRLHQVSYQRNLNWRLWSRRLRELLLYLSHLGIHD